MTTMNYLRKIMDVEDLVPQLERHRKRGQTIVTTNGCFDLLHYGHLVYLQQARNYGDVLVVGLNSDASVKRLKGKNRPLMVEKERAALIAGLECVDYVFIFDENDPSGWITKLKPDFHVKGKDYKGRTDLPECGALDKYGGKFVTTETVKLSSSDTVREILRIYDKLI